MGGKERKMDGRGGGGWAGGGEREDGRGEGGWAGRGEGREGGGEEREGNEGDRSGWVRREVREIDKEWRDTFKR